MRIAFWLSLAACWACSNTRDVGSTVSSAAPPPVTTPGSGMAAPTPASASAAERTRLACAPLEAYADRCHLEIDACSVARAKHCSEVLSPLRDEYLAALAACAYPNKCPAAWASSTDNEVCVQEATANVAPTDAQRELGSALCGSCDASLIGGDCNPALASFWQQSKRYPDGAVSVGGVGSSFLSYTAEVVARIRTACIRPSRDESCFQRFYDCIDAQTAPASIAEACHVGNTAPASPAF